MIPSLDSYQPIMNYSELNLDPSFIIQSINTNYKFVKETIKCK